MISLLLVEDETAVRDAVAQLCARGEAVGVRLLAACKTAAEAMALAKSGAEHIDVALVDLGLPDRSGVEVIATLRLVRPSTVCVAYTIFDDSPSVLAALKAGARGYLLKRTPPAELTQAIIQAASGGAPMTPSIAHLVIDELVRRDPPVDDSHEDSLTPREIEVLQLLGRGATYLEVGRSLGIGLGTVQTHVKRIYEKLEINSKAEAAAVAARRGLR